MSESTESGSWRWSATLHAATSPNGSHGSTPASRVAGAGLAGPLHRRALAVAAHARAVEHADRVEHAVVGDVGVGHADLVAVVEERRAAQPMSITIAARVLAGSSSHHRVGEAVVVVVAARPHRPRVRGQVLLGVLDRGAQRGRVELRVQEHEVEREVQLVVVAVERAELVGIEHVGLADEHAVRVVAVGERAPPAQHVVHLGPARVVDAAQPAHLHPPVVVLGGGRVVAQVAVLDDRVAHVDAEAGDAAVEPEAQDVVERVADVFVPPVEVGLRRTGTG